MDTTQATREPPKLPPKSIPKEVIYLEGAEDRPPPFRSIFGEAMQQHTEQEQEEADSAAASVRYTENGDTFETSIVEPDVTEHTVHVAYKWLQRRCTPRTEAKSPPKIAIFRDYWSLGDVIMTEPVVRGLRECNPGSEIWYLSRPGAWDAIQLFSSKPDWFVGTLINPVVRRVDAPLPDPMHGPWLLPMRGARRVDLLCPAGRHESRWKNHVYQNRLECFCQEAGVEPSCPRLDVPESEIQAAQEYLSAIPACRAGRPRVLRLPLAMDSMRSWPQWKWSKLSYALERAGFLPAVLSHRTLPHDFAGLRLEGLTLLNIAAIMRLASLSVSADTGTLHLAAGLGVPTLSLWGTTNPEIILRFYPNASYIWHRESSNPMKPPRCQSPCYYYGELRDERCEHHCPILHGITVEEVTTKVRELLEGRA
jgi:ADP-heptose:LPS heptosyltransferase